MEEPKLKTLDDLDETLLELMELGYVEFGPRLQFGAAIAEPEMESVQA